MAEIRVTRAGEGRFRVEVSEGASRTLHEVTARDEDLRRYGAEVAPERLLTESFRFLLEREPKESILRRFDLPVIERYFPEYPREIRKRLG
jgi:hypothetical protein